MRKQSLRYIKGLTVFCLLQTLWFCGEPVKKSEDLPAAPAPKVTPLLTYTIVTTHPHDVTAYTEGLLFYEGQLFESTGAPTHLSQTRSAVGIVDLNTGKFDKKIEIDRKIYFGEGILVLNNKLYQLTYQNQIAFIYDVKNFKQIGQFKYQNREGWGLTTEGQHLIMSDGTSVLTYLDPQNYSQVRQLEVTENGYAVDHLNELEYVNGFIYANVWLTNRIVKIDPSNGEVVGAIDCTRLFEMAAKKDGGLNELNGIAYNPANGHLYLTGKLWPEIYEISLPL